MWAVEGVPQFFISCHVFPIYLWNSLKCVGIPARSMFLFITLGKGYPAIVKYVPTILTLVLAPRGCHNQLLQAKWLETTAMSTLIALETRNLKPTCWPGPVFSEGLYAESVPCFSLSFYYCQRGSPWLSSKSLPPMSHGFITFSPFCSWLCFHMALVSVSVSTSLLPFL